MSKNYSFLGALEGVIAFWLIVLVYPFTTRIGRVVIVAIAAMAVALSFSFPKASASVESNVARKPRGNPVNRVAAASPLMRFFVGPQGMSESVDRSDACRTFHVFGHQVEQVGETDAVACGWLDLVTATVTAIFTPRVEVTPTVETTPTVITTPTIHPTQPPTTPTVVITETPVVVTPEPTQPPATETPIVVTATPDAPGNPGNDKPVGQTEHCEKGMCENDGGQDGEHGQSQNDDGKGNHDH